MSEVPILEMDEELTKKNDGHFPSDNAYKHNELAPKVIEDILGKDSILFFTNTDYFLDQDLELAHQKGFTIVQLDLDLATLRERNKQRVQNEGYANLDQWLEGMAEYQKNIKEQGFVDKSINMNQSTEDIAEELLQFLNR